MMRDSGRTIGKTTPIRRTVTLGYSRTFPTIAVPFEGPAGQTRIRLLDRLVWFDQGDERTGNVRHVVKNYGWVLYGPGDSDPIRFDDLEEKSQGSCANLWTP